MLGEVVAAVVEVSFPGSGHSRFGIREEHFGGLNLLGVARPAMGVICGIGGLPNVGKSTVFKALMVTAATTENYPCCTIEPNSRRVSVPDVRLEPLAGWPV